MTAGYSTTPLARKLSLKDGMRLWTDKMPETVWREIAAEGLALDQRSAPEPEIDAAHIFVTGQEELERHLQRLMPLLARSGFIWVSWPKKTANVPTDIVEDRIREISLPMGLVDVKVCAVDATWSGLKLMVRKARP